MRVRSQKKRNEIVDIAGALFLEQGYAAVSMALIATVVGGSKGTLYGYFASKEELFEAFVLRAGQERWQEFVAAPPETKGIEADLQELGCRYLRFLLSQEIMSVTRLVISEAARFPELGKIFYENGPKGVITTIAATLGAAAERGELKLDDPMAAAWRFKSLCESTLYEHFLWAIRNSVTEEEIMANVKPACTIFLQSFGNR